MKTYESVCILHPSHTDEEASQIVEKITDTLQRVGATLLHIENSGKKRLAYSIQHERRGTYVTVQFQAQGDVVRELERFHRMEDAIMKFMTVRIPQELVKRQLEESDGELQNAGV